MLKDNQLDRMLALFDTRTGAAFEDETLGPWLTKLLTKPIESKV